MTREDADKHFASNDEHYQKRDSAYANRRLAESDLVRSIEHSYGKGHNMAHHGEGKPHKGTT